MVNGKMLFLTQAESYYHRGHHISEYSPVEFECIVDILLAKPNTKPDVHCRGRPTRTGYPFSPTHPLFETHRGYIRAKMLTPVLGGAPPPTWKNVQSGDKDSKDCDLLARYLLCAFTPWGDNGPSCSLDATGLFNLCAAWDRSNAPLIERQRCRYIRNVMKKGYRNSRNESIATDWRNRGAEYWRNAPQKAPNDSRSGSDERDTEFQGSLPENTDIYHLLVQAAAGSPKRRTDVAAIKKVFSAVIEVASPLNSTVPSCRSSTLPVYQWRERDAGSSPIQVDSLSQVAAELQTYDTDSVGKAGEETKTDAIAFGGSKGSLENACFIAPCELSNEQFALLNRVLENIDQDGVRGQTLTLAHGGGGTGKSFVVRQICQHIHKRRYQVVSTCPTGAGACQLAGGMTFHAALKYSGDKRSKRLSARSAAFLKRLFGPAVVLVVVDEVSMFKAKMLVVLDQRLRDLYDADRVFGGKSILLTGDFWQLPVVKGTSLCKCLYMKTSDPTLLRARYLFGRFKVITLETQLRARECERQQQLLQNSRVLPAQYPHQNRWGAADGQYRPVDNDMVAALTRALTREDVTNDTSWLERSVILVTGNLDRAVLNACMATVLSRRNQQLLFRWRKSLRGEIPDPVQELVYREDDQPELFGYFFAGAPGQILDNGNGNVVLGVANGTRCWYHSLGWDDEAITATVLELAEKTLRSGETIVDLPHPPQYINVRLADRDGNEFDGSVWPLQGNLETEWVYDADGQPLHMRGVVVPIGIVQSNIENYSVMVTGFDDSSTTISYAQHAVDLAMVLTVWKAQGSTFDRVILLLEGSSSAPHYNFEHIYVALSRVRNVDSLRCFHLSPDFDRDAFYKLRPNIFTIKWLMDLDTDGYWHPHS